MFFSSVARSARSCGVRWPVEEEEEGSEGGDREEWEGDEEKNREEEVREGGRRGRVRAGRVRRVRAVRCAVDLSILSQCLC